MTLTCYFLERDLKNFIMFFDFMYQGLGPISDIGESSKYFDNSFIIFH